MAKEIRYGSQVLTVADDVTEDQARQALLRYYPDVANAKAATDAEGNITFSIQSGSKG